MSRPAARVVLAAVAMLLGCATAPPGAAAGEARALLDRSLRGLRDARATFTQTRVSTLLGTSGKPATGTIEFRAPRLVRLDFAGPSPTTILVRGDSAWIEQPAARQVIRTSARASGAPPLPFLEESVAVLEKTYAIAETGPRALTLTPRARPAPWRALDLVLDGKSGLPRSAVLRQSEEESIRFEFGRWTVNGGVPASRFAPVFAPGTKAVDL